MLVCVYRALTKIDELFGESTGSSESEEETVADVAAGKRLKRQFSVQTIPEFVFEQSQSQSESDNTVHSEIFPHFCDCLMCMLTEKFRSSLQNLYLFVYLPL